jgi:hypothetical protein
VELGDCCCEEGTDFSQGQVHQPKQHKNTLQGNSQEVPRTNKRVATNSDHHSMKEEALLHYYVMKVDHHMYTVRGQQSSDTQRPR